MTTEAKILATGKDIETEMETEEDISIRKLDEKRKNSVTKKTNQL